MDEVKWGALILVAHRVADDIRENRPLRMPDASGSPVEALEYIRSVLPAWKAAWTAHQGIATGAADLLEHFANAGVPHAGAARQAVLHVPGALAEAEKWLPTIISALTAIAPAPMPLPGMGPPVGRG